MKLYIVFSGDELIGTYLNEEIALQTVRDLAESWGIDEEDSVEFHEDGQWDESLNHQDKVRCICLELDEKLIEESNVYILKILETGGGQCYHNIVTFNCFPNLAACYEHATIYYEEEHNREDGVRCDLCTDSDNCLKPLLQSLRTTKEGSLDGCQYCVTMEIVKLAITE